MSEEKKLYVQYGSGTDAPDKWLNFDVSLILKIRENFLLNILVLKLLRFEKKDIYPKAIKYGDIIKGLPIEKNSCDGVFCSHVLEHLTLHDFRIALKNTYSILKEGGKFRVIVPDLECRCREYITNLDNGDVEANNKFMLSSNLGVDKHPSRIKSYMRMFYFCSYHFWMWDKLSLKHELSKAGFTEIRQCHYGDSKDEMFGYVENEHRYFNVIAFECTK